MQFLVEGNSVHNIYFPINANEQGINNFVVEYLMSHPEQKREVLIVNETLNSVARNHALDMINREYFSHTTPEGVTANQRVIMAGYPLEYNPLGNNVESLAGGYKTLNDALEALLESEGHRKHVLGLHPMFEEQLNIGVAWMDNKSYSHEFESLYNTYLVIITAP